MADWGLLQGLGAGMQELGGAVFKAKFLDKLKEEEAVRKENRDQQRALAKVARTEMITGPDGMLVEQDFNANGDKINEWRMPSKTKLDAIKHEEATRKQQLTKDALDIAKGEFEVATQEEAWDLEKGVKNALIGQREASGEAALYRAYNPPSRSGSGGSIVDNLTGSDGAVSPDKVAFGFMESPIGKGLEKQYTTGDNALTFDEYMTVVKGATRIAAAEKKDAMAQIRLALKGAKENKAANGTTRFSK